MYENTTPAQAARFAEVVFTGVVVVAGTDSCPGEYIFDVTRAVKGVTECRVTMLIPLTSCTFSPELGHEYVMYAFWDDDGWMCRPGLTTNICIRSAPIEYAADDLVYFERFSPMYLTEMPGEGLLAVDADDNVYIAATDNQIIKYSKEGTLLNQWGSEGTGDGQFQTLTDIAVDSNGNVFVSDNGNHRIQKFDTDGNFVTKWGSDGTDPGQFLIYTLHTVDVSGVVYVIDGTGRIQKFTNDGVYMDVWPVGVAAGDIEAGPDGTIQIIDPYTHQILIYNSDGIPQGEWVPGCSPPHQFPSGLSGLSGFSAGRDGRRWFIMETGTPGMPTVVEYLANGLPAGFVAVPSPTSVACGSGDLVFVATGGKVKVYGERIDTSTGLETPGYAVGPQIDVFPNPFNPGTRVYYRIDKPGPVKIWVFDVKGRRVRELFISDRAAVDGFVDWNGRDDSDREVPSGIYFIRLDSREGRTTKKAISLK